jgi:hypothetical protein
MRCSLYRNIATLAVALAAAISMPFAARGEAVEACLADAWPQRQIACLKELAIEEGDPTLCLRSEKPSVRWLCVALYAEQAGDASTCEILPADDLEIPGISGDLCRTHLAIAWRTPALCEKLATPNLGDSCLLKLVELGEDGMLCERIKNETLAGTCREF